MAFNAVFLHGLAQNSKVMASDFEPMKNLLAKLLNITFLNAPHFLDAVPAFFQAASEKTDDELRKLEAEFRENHYKRKGKKEHYERTWFFTDTPGNYSPQIREVKVLGLEESVELVLDECKRTGADGLIGFSQGSLVSTLVAQRAAADPSVGWKPKFCLLFSAPFPFCNSLAELLRAAPKLAVPSLHVLGKADTVVPNSRSLMFTDLYFSPEVHYHEGAHTVPHSDDLSVYERFFQGLSK